MFNAKNRMGVLIFLLLINCDLKERYIPENIVSAHIILEESIDDYLLNNEAILGFGGEVHCAHTLIGGAKNELYVIFGCQEFYKTNDGTLQQGTGFLSPAIITYKDLEVISILKPRDGSFFSRDIKSMFPPKIARQIFDNTFTSNIYKQIEEELNLERLE